MEENKKFDLNELAENWPSRVVARTQEDLDKFSGGILNARTLANLDSQGRGPKGRIKIGRRVAYPVRALVKWMEERAIKFE